VQKLVKWSKSRIQTMADELQTGQMSKSFPHALCKWEIGKKQQRHLQFPSSCDFSLSLTAALLVQETTKQSRTPLKDVITPGTLHS